MNSCQSEDRPAHVHTVTCVMMSHDCTCIVTAQASYGVNLIRFFGNIDGPGKPAGYGYTDTTEKSILLSIHPITLAGTYNETNFQRFDLVLAQACKLPTSMSKLNSKVFNTFNFAHAYKLGHAFGLQSLRKHRAVQLAIANSWH